MNNDLFDELLPVAIDYIKVMDEDKKVSQLIIHTITMDMILNILKTMKEYNPKRNYVIFSSKCF